MELRDSIYLFSRRKALALSLIVLVVAASYAWAYLQPVRFTTSVSFAVNRVNREDTKVYEYDGYYALQASDLFSDTVVSWLQTPSVLVEIYKQAGKQDAAQDIQSLTSQFKTKKFAAQNIVVTYSSPTESEAEKLASAMTDVIKAQTESSNRTSQGKALFEVDATTPVIAKASPNPLLIGVISFAVGLILALFLVPFVAYLAPRPPQP